MGDYFSNSEQEIVEEAKKDDYITLGKSSSEDNDNNRTSI